MSFLVKIMCLGSYNIYRADPVGYRFDIIWRRRQFMTEQIVFATYGEETETVIDVNKITGPLGNPESLASRDVLHH